MRVVVIGGGVIGLACAYELRKRGAEVTVLEARELGKAASWGNAGWIVPSLSGPVPEPGITLTALRYLLKPDSPLYIKPRLNPSFLRWLWSFRRHCNARDYQAGFLATAGLNARTMELYDAWQAEGVLFEMHRAGLLFALLNPKYIEKYLEDFEYLGDYGYTVPESLSGEEVRQRAPILSDQVAGGFMIEQERHVEPFSLTQGLARCLGGLGAALHSGTPVTGLVRENGRLVAVRTNHDTAEGDAFLLAAGAWSAALARMAGCRLPVESGKGYSITIRQPNIRLEHPLYLGEVKVGISPYDGSIRIAGTMELSGISDAINPRRLDAIRRSVGRYLREQPVGEQEITWAGMRPLTPDGLPAIGRAPGLSNLFVATGHSMLGITLAPATAAAVAELMCVGKSSTDLRPFDPGRFQ